MTKLLTTLKRHLPTAAAALAGTALLATALHAQDPAASPSPEAAEPGHHHGGWHHHGPGGGGLMGHGLRRIREALGLTDTQVQQIQDILRASRDQVKPLVQNLMTEKRAERVLIQAPTVDEPAIRAQAAKVAAVEADLAVAHAKIANQIRGILTPEQIQKIQDFQGKMDGRIDGFMGHLFGGGHLGR